MKRAVLLIAVFALATSAAHGQTSNCSWIGQIWTCNQNQPQAQVNTDIFRQQMENQNRQTEEANRNYWLRLQQLQQERRDRAAAEANARVQQERDEQQARLDQQQATADQDRRQVGQLLAGGKCAEAQQYALNAGNIDLANQAKAYCAGQAGK